ncbi:MAG: cysteine desulfurase NifS [Candidatus Cloacimonas sp. SDB]|nr:MAG: cysteine desulfurase NifS [Candidatus Cloacimonas sp. SDB]
MQHIYLDYNASTPLLAEVADAMQPYLINFFGNPSSRHWYGRQSREAIELARAQVAHLLNCCPEEIIFTSGGTESNNYAIKGSAFARTDIGNHIITSAIEHPAVLNVCRYLEKFGFETTYIAVDEFGIIDLEELVDSIKPTTILISIMQANNETGSIQPIKEIAEIAEENNIIFHTDAAQSVGKISVNVKNLGIDLLSVAGHKMYAPKGVGVLYKKKNIKLDKFMHGANHEGDNRAGTENVLEIVGLGKAAEIASRDLASNYEHFKELRDLLHKTLKKNFPDLKLNGHPEFRLPNTLNISFPNIKADLLLDELESLAASAGAACHSGSVEISHVLQAMRVPEKFAMGAIRFSTGRYTTRKEIEEAAQTIIDTVRLIR